MIIIGIIAYYGNEISSAITSTSPKVAAGRITEGLLFLDGGCIEPLTMGGERAFDLKGYAGVSGSVTMMSAP